MTNREIASMFNELAVMLELHEENEFKIKTYANAYLALRKLDINLLEQSKEENKTIRGIGASIADKIEEIKLTSTFVAYEEMKAKTPEGIRQIIKIKGLGPKKVKAIWRDLGIESIGELLYACQENRLLKLKGFGQKLQDEVIANIQFLTANQHLYLFPHLEIVASEIYKSLVELNPNARIEWTGEFRKRVQVLDKLEVVSDVQLMKSDAFTPHTNGHFLYLDRYPICFYHADTSSFEKELCLSTLGSDEFMSIVNQASFPDNATELEFIQSVFGKWIPAECRDLSSWNDFNADLLVDDHSIKGVVHNHSTYSDGLYSIREMALECIRLGYEYFVISDHSKTASYANGLSIEHVEMQWREIEQLNKELSPFKIFKSIESDILGNGDLDYDADILSQFDLVIASIHQNLNMDLDKAMSRLITAIENPFTRILGHPTGRLLLSRKGYPVDFKKLIDACAANGVVVELNANPYRLDIDSTHIEYAQERQVLVSINPDAHNLKAIQDIKYGIQAARRGGLRKSNCLNTNNLENFEVWIKSKK
ncbi:MAG: helix-hairpin-helix domain-containing protein [Saprospiraceae bacterium]